MLHLPARSGLSSLLRGRRGVAAVEFAVVAGIAVVVMLAVWDLGNAAQQTIRLQEALRAAGQYALAFPTDAGGISNAVTNALPGGWTDVTVSGPNYSCNCWSSSSSSATASGVAPDCTCPNGLTLQMFVQIGVMRPFTPALISTLTSVSASYVVRFQ